MAGDDAAPEFAVDELANFQHIARALMPSSGQIPDLPGLDVHGEYMPLRGVVGGDHIIYLDFNRRFDLDRRIAKAEREDRPEIAGRLKETRRHAGFLLADVAGHHVTDGLVGAMLHQAFLLGVHYELERHGRVTTELFELLNQRFFHTTGTRKYLTMVYTEISDRGGVRIISAGHPPPFLLSRSRGKFRRIPASEMLTFPPIGMFPSYTDLVGRVERGVRSYDRDYAGTEEVDLLAAGDAILLYTDGLYEHGKGYFPERVEEVLTGNPRASSEELCSRLKADILAHAKPADDISFILIRRTEETAAATEDGGHR